MLIVPATPCAAARPIAPRRSRALLVRAQRGQSRLGGVARSSCAACAADRASAKSRDPRACVATGWAGHHDGAHLTTMEDAAMTTRREFLSLGTRALAGLAFVGCDLLAAAPARAQARRREVLVGGRRVKTVDVHAHCAVPEAMALMNLKLAGPGSPLP